MNHLENYADFLKKRFDLKRPLTIVADSSNGTTGIVLEKLKDVPNLTLHLINNTADGDFPAHGPNPLEPGAADEISRKVVELNADFGAIFDADGDRAFFVDEKGVLMHSYKSALLLFKNNEPPYACDELVYQSLRHINAYDDTQLRPSKIGSIFVKDELRKSDGSVGAEFSCHFYFKDFFGADSGIFALVEVANVVSASNDSVSSYFAKLPPHELINENLKITQTVPEIVQIVEDAYKELATVTHRDGITLDFGNSWISIRGSNTEPLLRLIAGAPTTKEAQEMIDAIKVLLKL